MKNVPLEFRSLLMPRRPCATSFLRHILFLAMAWAAPVSVTQAAADVRYFTWQAVTLPASSGASCGNGSPYRFFVNRTPLSSNAVVVYEGGGACWDQRACQGIGLLSASNPTGIPLNHLASLQRQLGIPFIARIDPLQWIQTQKWNIVFVPYCTGDVHMGHATALYSDADATRPLTYAHRGLANSAAMADWLQANMARPDKLLITGESAGGAGATANYATVRQAITPKQAALLADAGPLFPAPRQAGSTRDHQADTARFPSLPLHRTIDQAWGLSRPEGLFARLAARHPGQFDANDLGSLSTGLGRAFPQDRFGFATQQADEVYADYSYSKFYPDIAASTGKARVQRLNDAWRQDIANWVAGMDTQGNVGYYIPNGRVLFKSHGLTSFAFWGTAIKEAGLSGVGAFVDNLIDGQGQPMRAFERQRILQNALPLGADALVNLFMDDEDKR